MSTQHITNTHTKQATSWYPGEAKADGIYIVNELIMSKCYKCISVTNFSAMVFSIILTMSIILMTFFLTAFIAEIKKKNRKKTGRAILSYNT